MIQYLMTNLNLLEGTVDHGDEHVEQHYHHGNVVNPVQHVANVLDEFVSVIDHNRPDLRQSKYSPEQSLEALLQAGRVHREEGNGGRGGEKLFLNSNKPLIIRTETLTTLCEKSNGRRKSFLGHFLTVFNIKFMSLLNFKA